MNQYQFNPEIKHFDPRCKYRSSRSKTERTESIKKELDEDIVRAEEEEKEAFTFRMNKLDGTDSPIKAIDVKRNAGLIDRTKQQSQGGCEGKEISGCPIIELFDEVKHQFIGLNMKIDRIAGMIETPEEEIIEEETIEVTIKEVTSEEVETFAATCRQLQSELYATIQHNEILESKMISLQERVVALEMKMNNNILDERDSQLASDDFWEGCDGHSNLRWDLGTEEDEW